MSLKFATLTTAALLGFALALPAGADEKLKSVIDDPARPAEVKPRLAQPAVLHHERYDAAGEAAAVAHYDPLMRRFQQEQQRDDRPWSQVSVQRIGSPGALMGRHRLREALNALGFTLR